MAAKTARAVKARSMTVLVPDEGDTEKEGAEDETKGIPLFEGLGDEVQITVYRLEPIEEGTLGTLPSDADEGTIRRRWGGGVYKINAKGTDGRFQRRQRTVTIGGDPKFESRDALKRYRLKMSGASDDEPKPAAPPAAPVMGTAEILAILQASHSQAMAFMQAQVAASAQQADQRAQAAQKLADDARARDQQFLGTMIQLIKSDAKVAPGPDPTAMMTVLLKGLELGRDMGGEKGEGDPVTAFIAALPQIIPQAQALLTSGQAAPGSAPAAPAAANQQQPQGPRVVLSGPIAEQLQKTVNALTAKGYNAEQALNVALQQLATVPNAPTKPDPAPAAAAAASSPAPAAPPAAKGNGTSPAARATRRR